MGKKKWVRHCEADACEECKSRCGKVYSEKKEAQAKEKLHEGCKCTAILVDACELGSSVSAGDLSVTVGSFSADWDGSWSFSATATNNGTVKLEGVEVTVQVYAGNSELSSKTFTLGDMEPTSSQSLTDSGKVDAGEAGKVMTAGASVYAETTYTKAGESKDEDGGCYWSLF